jgi:anti-anti-sigma factor
VTTTSVPAPTAILWVTGQAGGTLTAAGRCWKPEFLDTVQSLVPSPAAAAPTPARVGDLDLRIYAPIPQVVIVRVSGVVDDLTAPVLTKCVGKQLTRAPHVVIDLSQVTTLDSHSLATLSRLQDKAAASGTHIHLATAQRGDVHRALHSTGLDQLFSLDPTVEAVIADVRAQRHEQISTKLTWRRKAQQDEHRCWALRDDPASAWPVRITSAVPG